MTALFYLVAFGTVALLARHPGRLTVFERLALLVTLAAGVTAIRSIVWFALVALVLVPQLLDGAISKGQPRVRQRGRKALAAASAVALVAAFSVVATRPDSWFTAESPHAGGAAVAEFMAAHPQATLFADDRYADWLLWEHPQLVGRVAYDIRFELFTLDQLNDLRAYRRVTGADWNAAASDFTVVAFDPRDQSRAYTDAIKRSDLAVVYRDPMIVVAAR